MTEHIYDPVEHKYYTDGIRWPSVTEFLAPLNDFSKINPGVLKRKCAFGKNIHRITELEALGTLDETNLSDFQLLYLSHIRRWQKKHGINIENAIGELPLWCTTFKFCGTPDLVFPSVVFSSANHLLVEVKTRPFKSLIDGLQLAGQEILCRENYGWSTPAEQRVLSLSEKGYKYPLVATPAEQKENINRFIWLTKRWWAEGGEYSPETITQMRTWGN